MRTYEQRLTVKNQQFLFSFFYSPSHRADFSPFSDHANRETDFHFVLPSPFSRGINEPRNKVINTLQWFSQDKFTIFTITHWLFELCYSLNDNCYIYQRVSLILIIVVIPFSQTPLWNLFSKYRLRVEIIRKEILQLCFFFFSLLSIE